MELINEIKRKVEKCTPLEVIVFKGAKHEQPADFFNERYHSYSSCESTSRDPGNKIIGYFFETTDKGILIGDDSRDVFIDEKVIYSYRKLK